MEVYQLRTFQMVAEEGNLTRAAKRLNASQPAVSAHIKMLEEELGVDLFLRTPRGMSLTRDGMQLKAYADKVLDTMDEMVAYAGQLRKTLNGEFRIGINTDPSSLRISDFFGLMQSDYPNLRIHLLQSNTGDVLDKLEEGVLDGGFMYGETLSDKITTLELQKLPLVIAGPRLWQDRLRTATPAELALMPWILTPEDCPFHTVAARFFAEHNLKPEEVALTDQETAILAMVRGGAGIALVPERDALADDKGGEMAVWPGESFLLRLSFASLKKRGHDARINAVQDALRKVWNV